MKRGTPDHWKMDELARLLNIPPRYALIAANGIMERLWHYTAKYHPRGDIGSAPDWAIADACGWDCGRRADRVGRDDGKVAAFIGSLVVAKWVDRDNKYRLVVHDWHEHAESSVKKYLKENGLSFCSLDLKSLQSGQPLPSLPFPSLPFPQPTSDRPAETKTEIQESGFSLEEFEEAWHRHKNYSGQEGIQRLALQKILGMNGQFNVERFRVAHPVWCEYWSRVGWNAFGSKTFIGWIEAGMPDPPEEPEDSYSRKQRRRAER